jgi:F-type H+-transporting ATPase subunit delta
LATIANGGRATLLPVIAELLRAELTAARGEVVAEITSARPLAPTMQKQIADALAKATGKKVQMQLKEDAAVIGGVAIQIGSLRLDATLAGALNNLRGQLLASANRSL